MPFPNQVTSLDRQTDCYNVIGLKISRPRFCRGLDSPARWLPTTRCRSIKEPATSGICNCRAAWTSFKSKDMVHRRNIQTWPPTTHPTFDSECLHQVQWCCQTRGPCICIDVVLRNKGLQEIELFNIYSRNRARITLSLDKNLDPRKVNRYYYSDLIGAMNQLLLHNHVTVIAMNIRGICTITWPLLGFTYFCTFLRHCVKTFTRAIRSKGGPWLRASLRAS